MMRKRIWVLLAFLLGTAAAAMGQTNAVKVRVVQCWDDSLTTDIPLVELLKKHHAKATFNIIPRETRLASVVKKLKTGKLSLIHI